MLGTDVAYSQTVSAPPRPVLRGYYPWVDYAKGMGIILVVFGHVLRGIEKAGIARGNDALVILDSVIYSFHMPLFFFVSGLFFYNSLEKRRSDGLIRNKFDTIVYPYIVWSTIQGVVEIVLSSHTNGHFSSGELVSILWAPRDQFWFLYILMMCFVVFIIFEVSFSKINYLFMSVILSFFCVFRGKLDAPFIFDLFLANAVFFSVGILCGRYMSFFEEVCRKYIILLLVVAGCSQYIFHFTYHFIYTRMGFSTLFLAMASILFFIGVSLNLEGKLNIIKIIGKYSMPIYLIHVITGSGTRIVLHGVFHVDDPYVHVALGTAMGVFCPIALYKYANAHGMGALFTMPRGRKSLLSPSSAN
ncbi:acyltransferase family protein [Gluconacetobacter sacchari]|uniref:Acyltransferase n=1 Tax=Gluconacetobacter sacchari TaxID=92759 RepID=A0A7W4IA43_9PROT|nr:acyltransferase [Gluconacetobacter sacchari]MBB2159007.1 acyltransferase [Gluconacetobacter sacchari]